MKLLGRLPLNPKISRPWLTVLLGVFGLSAGPIQAERVLDLGFWPADQAELALGGLWEFHAQKLLDPAQRLATSEILVDISESWARFRPALHQAQNPVEQASYVMLIRGLQPRALGYSVNVPAAASGTTLIVAPKYAPERKQVATARRFAVFSAWLSHFLRAPLRLTFMPRGSDEIWLLIVQKRTSPDADAQAIPRLSVAGSQRRTPMASGF